VRGHVPHRSARWNHHRTKRFRGDRLEFEIGAPGSVMGLERAAGDAGGGRIDQNRPAPSEVPR